ncbi:KH domain-containing protein [Candidatus Daviesbacteria bacterium]|nr:KH domain-containing protein [Candidatus Daviesbacteria bacterium]
MEQELSNILDYILGLLLLEGSYEIEEDENGLHVLIETKDAGRLIGSGGQSLDGLQLIVNQMISRKMADDYKRVILDVGGWRKQKEEELAASAKSWVTKVLDTGADLELEPMSPWQRRIVHMVVSEMEGVESESIGEGRDRHIVIKVKSQK